MNIAQQPKVAFVLFLLWVLPISTLPRVAAKPTTRAQLNNSQPISKDPENAKLKLAATENFGKLPLSFEANRGQVSEQVRFLSRGKGYTVYLTPAETVF